MADSAGPAASDQSGAPRHGVDSEVGRLRTVHAAPPRPRAQAADAAQQRQAALRRHPVGRPGPGRARRVRPGAARPRRRGALPRRPARDRARGRARPATRRSARCCATRGSARRCTGASRPTCAGCTRPTWPTTLMAGLAHEEIAPVGGLVYRFMDRHDFVIDPLPNLLFTRDSSVWIRDRVAVTSLAMPARMRETTLTRAIYRTTRGSPAPSWCTGRRTSRSRAATCCCSHPAWSPSASASAPPRPAPSGWRARCSTAAWRHGARRADRPGAGHDAPRHRLHDGRRRRGGDVPEHRRHPAGVHGHRRRRAARRPGRSRSWSRPPRRWTSTRCGSSTPGSTRSPPSASSGTTATTRWPSGRGWRSPTSATWRPTPGSRRPASRWSGSPAASSAAAGAARGACPARSAGTRSQSLTRAAQ